MRHLLILAALLLVGAGRAEPFTDEVYAIEVNQWFQWIPRETLIFRDRNGDIVDWRWSTEQNFPQYIRRGRYLSTWNDNGIPRVVWCQRVYFTVTSEDQEVRERAILPEHRRRKLSTR